MNWLDEINEKTWVIGDTHFKHANINQYEPTRLEAIIESGFSDPDEFFIDNCNSIVSNKNLVLYVGDFSVKSGLDTLDRLNGRIILLLGNHDMPMLNKFRDNENKNTGKLMIIIGINSSQDFEPKGVSTLIRTINGKKIMFSHYPLITEDKYMKGKALETKQAITDVFHREQCELNIHGHVHSNDEDTDKEKEMNVSLERIEFKPVSLKELLG